nr:hypothetical protein [Tanacetum cinerariifolium]
MMQRYVEDPSIDIPFIFDIDGRTLELETPNLNGERLLDLVNNDVAFNNLDDDDTATTPNPVLRSATRGSSSSRSVHTYVWTEVRREVHVRTEVYRFVEEEVCTQSVDKEDVPEIGVLEKNNVNGSVSVQVGGLDHQSTEGVSHYLILIVKLE